MLNHSLQFHNCLSMIVLAKLCAFVYDIFSPELYFLQSPMVKIHFIL